MSMLFAALLIQASTPPTSPNPVTVEAPVTAQVKLGTAPMPAGTSTIVAPVMKQFRHCREMLMTSSRLGAIKMCKTWAEWRRWEKCHGATRYCAPVKRAAELYNNDDLICKYLKVTGSRIATEKICATRRQWDLTEQETQERVRNTQKPIYVDRGGQ